MEQKRPAVNINCRFYEKKFPNENDLVMVFFFHAPSLNFSNKGSSHKRC